MIPIIHRVNTIKQLNTIDVKHGVEIDIRCYKNRLVLNHEPFGKGDVFESYLQNYNHNLLILNIKESGIEELTIEIAKKYLKNREFFLLDVEIPFVVSQNGKYKEYMSTRYSEYESFESLKNFNNLSDWVWIDTFSKLPKLNNEIIDFLKTKKTCLVSPSRWGREKELTNYIDKFKEFNYQPDYVMN